MSETIVAKVEDEFKVIVAEVEKVVAEGEAEVKDLFGHNTPVVVAVVAPAAVVPTVPAAPLEGLAYWEAQLALEPPATAGEKPSYAAQMVATIKARTPS